MEGHERSRKVKEGQIIRLYCQPQSHSLSSGLWTLDFGIGFWTWILDLDLGLGFGTGLGLDNNPCSLTFYAINSDL